MENQYRRFFGVERLSLLLLKFVLENRFFFADIALHSKLSVISGHDATLAASYQEIEIKIREISNAFTAV